LPKALKKEGTDNLLVLMGGPMLLAEASCIKQGIRPIDRRHEQAAALCAPTIGPAPVARNVRRMRPELA
jgi:thiamine pyrophosphate-dependent acetolactate synthase large subunit-like protein